MYEPNGNIPLQTTPSYDDENVANDNYYERKENDNEPHSSQENCNDAPSKSGNKTKEKQPQANPAKDVDDQSVLDKASSNTNEYYLSIQQELDELFKKYPRDKTLEESFAHSEWVRVKGDKKRPICLVGVIYEELKRKYICYAIPAEDKNAPPAEIKDACVFVPQTPYDTEKGFFVIFQNATTGLTIANPQ
jgi:hypothetical protein